MHIQSFFRGAVCCVFLLSLTAFSGKKHGTSVIPDKREFPLSQEISPCDNFFEHVCSEAISGFELREDRSKHIFSFSDSNERLLEAKKKFLTELPTKKNLSPRAQELSNVFKACMNEKAGAKEEKEIVAKMTSEVGKLKDHTEFQKFLTKKMEDAEFSFVDWGAISNQEDPDWNDVYFLADLQTLPEKSYYDKADVTGDLQNLAQAFFETIGMDKAEERAKSVVDFEKEFSKSYPTPAEIRELINIKTGIGRKEFVKQYPAFQMDHFLSQLPARTHLRHLTPANFEWVNEKLSKTPLDVLKNVYLFRALPGYLDDAYPAYFKKAFEFRKKHLGGPNVRPVRQERCTFLVMDRFAKEIDAELLPVIFPDFPEEKFVKLVEKVRAAIVTGIQKNSWVSAKSRKEGAHKIKVAGLQLVKPRNDAEWNFNPPAHYSPEKSAENIKKLDKNLSKKELKELAQRRDRSRWEMGPLTVNAYYSPSDNKFVMPIGILQYPFYDPKLPESTNLGAVGMVVGHELGHGIDDHGARYDAAGRMNQWMPEKDVKEFVKRGEGLVQQFQKIGHDGKLTLGENIGDLVGLTFAYRAAFPNGKGDVQAKKDFYIQYGRAWCGVVRPKLREMLLKTDPHAAVEARVNEQVKHQAPFQEVFGCKLGDPMVLDPKDRVSIW